MSSSRPPIERSQGDLGTDSDLDRAHTEAGGFGLFVRTLIAILREVREAAAA